MTHREQEAPTTSVPAVARAAAGWVRGAMVAVLAASAALYGSGAAGSGYTDYYATAAKSMSVSWTAFFFGAFDPQSTITLDKLSGFLLPQALSARTFGFSAWSLALPQAVEGVITVLAAYLVIRRWIGPLGGLIGASILAFTPLLVSMFSHPMEDGMLTMCTTLAIAAWQRALDTDHRRWMLLAAAWVGLGFQAKMMQAWLVLPAMAFAYLMVGDNPVGRKLRRLALAGIVALAVSLSWMTAIALIPASRRPFIDGTTSNSIYAMVFGYNGINRFISGFLPGALGPNPQSHSDPSGVGLVPGLLAHTPLKLLLPQYATQIGWLYPLAAAGLVLGIHVVRRRSARIPSGERLRHGVLLNTGLILTMVSVMSVMSLPHTAYLACMAFPLAALSAIGVVLLWRTAREAGPLRFAAPITVAVQTVWTVALINQYPKFSGWATVVGLAGGLAALLLAARALGRLPHKGTLLPLSVLSLSCVMLAPLLWSLSTLVPAYAGTANDAYAGPAPRSAVNHTTSQDAVYGIGLDSNRNIHQTASNEARVFRFARARSSHRTFVLATDTWRSAAPLILAGDRGVLPIGGYTSRVAAPSVHSLRQLVAKNELKYILLTDPHAKASVTTAHLSAVRHWVETTCHLVPQAKYAATAAQSVRTHNNDRLYACSPKTG